MQSSYYDLSIHRQHLLNAFGERLQEGTPLARLTAARVGGKADMLLNVNSARELAEATLLLWHLQIPFVILGGGSNVLISDRGLREFVILNRARATRFETESPSPKVWAESGANLGLVARQSAKQGLSGLEWAAGIPGTVGGAVVGNAGAHGGNIAGNLCVAEILHHDCMDKSGDWAELREVWPVEKFDYAYRSSRIKKNPGQVVVLSAELKLEKTPSERREEIEARMEAFNNHRRLTQPPGASMGSMFKNPPGDYAGRLIEAAGLKGAKSGQAQVSSLHANFFVNHGNATAADIYQLLCLARQRVADQFGVQLELEIELLGEWDEQNL